MKHKSLLMCLSLLVCTTLAIGGTLAYLTDTESTVNTFTMGNVDITLEEDFKQGATLLPGVDIEKKPVITNVSNNDAWVWMVWSIPSALDIPTQGSADGSSNNTVHWNYLAATTEGYVNQTRVDKSIADGYLDADVTAEDILASNKTWEVYNSLGQGVNMIPGVEIDGVEYNSYVLLYNKALEPGETTLPSVVKVYLDAHVDITPEGDLRRVKAGEVTELDWNINKDGDPKIIVSAFAIQKDGFDTVEEGFEAFMGQWTADGTIDADLLMMGTNQFAVSVASDEELLEALTADKPTIVVELMDDVTLDITAWETLALGGDSTTSIKIIGNGNILTFNKKNSDWNHIATKNDATLTLENITLTDSGKNNGPWNRYDLNFDCPVVLNNVIATKAIALKDDAKLSNVFIEEAGDNYAIWISPNGQNVSINALTVKSTGRGIKIDDQYLTDPGVVTLTVKNSEFTTAKKAAIMVKCAVGAEVNVVKTDISGVAADSTNAVWVDGDAAATADLVKVTGATKIVEP